jgi:predicted secreted protein
LATVSGQYGKIVIGSSNATECSYWSFDRTAAEHAYASCATNGYKKRIAGTKDGSGSLKGFQDPAAPIETYFVEGDLVTLRLYYTASKYYSVPAMITRLHIENDIDDGAIVPWEADFGINGAWTLPA